MILAASVCALMQATAVLTGTVLTDSTERPIANAEIAIVSLGLTARSDSAGNFTLSKIPRGAYDVTVRALGFGVLLTRLAFANGQRIETDLLMQRVTQTAQPLERVDVKAKSLSGDSPRIAEFDERMKFGIGTFLTQPTFEKADGRKLAEVLVGRLPGVRTANIGRPPVRTLVTSRGSISLRGPSVCPVRTILDGLVQDLGSLGGIDSLDPSLIAAVEYYTVAQTPAQFNFAGNAPCGTLVIWTRYKVK